MKRNYTCGTVYVKRTEKQIAAKRRKIQEELHREGLSVKVKIFRGSEGMTSYSYQDPIWGGYLVNRIIKKHLG